MEENILQECEELLVDELTGEMAFGEFEEAEEIVLDEAFKQEVEALKAYEKTVLQEAMESEELELPFFEEDTVSEEDGVEEIISILKKYPGLKITLSF